MVQCFLISACLIDPPKTLTPTSHTRILRLFERQFLYGEILASKPVKTKNDDVFLIKNLIDNINIQKHTFNICVFKTKALEGAECMTPSSVAMSSSPPALSINSLTIPSA